MFTSAELSQLAAYVVAQAEHTVDPKLQKRLDVIFQRIQALLGVRIDDTPSTGRELYERERARIIAEQSSALADYAGKALTAAGELGIKENPIADFPLSRTERQILSVLLGVSAKLKAKLRKTDTAFTIAEATALARGIAKMFQDRHPFQQLALLRAAKKLVECLEGSIVKPTKSAGPKKTKSGGLVYQFMITLMETAPAIWRRIQVTDCTLDKLHEHIQMAMGWTNSHLHQFEIEGKCYGDPMLLDDGFDDFKCIDSTKTKISQILPKNGKHFAFGYQYDFGDGWEHEILFEGCPKRDPKAKYPLCVEGARACPPEDVGGVPGFEQFLEAITNPQHDEHDEWLEWSGGFDATVFDAKAATKAMRRGLPNWRENEEAF